MGLFVFVSVFVMFFIVFYWNFVDLLGLGGGGFGSGPVPIKFHFSSLRPCYYSCVVRSCNRTKFCLERSLILEEIIFERVCGTKSRFR